jgi:hypothetical protein
MSSPHNTVNGAEREHRLCLIVRSGLKHFLCNLCDAVSDLLRAVLQ